jgi:hypothetical protein
MIRSVWTIWIFTVVFSDAAEWHVATSGNDVNPGSESHPFRTLAAAMDRAQAGDTVNVHGGTYREPLTSVRSGRADAPITIRNYNGEAVILSACDVLQGPWTEQSGGVYRTPVQGELPVVFWDVSALGVDGSGFWERDGRLVASVVNSTGQRIIHLRSSEPVSGINFFENPVIWRIRGLSIQCTGRVPLPMDSALVFFSIMSGADSGFASEDALNVSLDGNGLLRIRAKTDLEGTWGPIIGSLSDPAITGFDLVVEPGGVERPADTVFITLTAFPGGQVVTGSWAVAQSNWSDGGDGSRSRLQIRVSETVAETNQEQQFTFRLGSYEVESQGTLVLSDMFDDGDVSATSGILPIPGRSTGVDQIFIDGQMQPEARFPNKVSSDWLNPDAAAILMSDDYNFSGAAFSNAPIDFFKGARFSGGIKPAWTWQCSTVLSNCSKRIYLDPQDVSARWWPNHNNLIQNSGTGFVYGTLNLLDEEGEWIIQRDGSGENMLHLKTPGGADPSSLRIERKMRNWCIDINGHDYITVRGLNIRGGAVRMDGVENVLEECDLRYLSHFIRFMASDHSRLTGIESWNGVRLAGEGGRVERCVFSETAGSFVVATGTRHRITRNRMSGSGYSGAMSASAVLERSGHHLCFNTIADAGRDGIRLGGVGHLVAFNDLSRAGRMCFDLGLVYTFGTDSTTADGRSTRIAYNWLHERGNSEDELSKGVYLDNGSRRFLVDHNVVWDFGENEKNDGLHCNSPNYGHLFCHNTVIGCPSYNDRTFTSYPDNSNSFWTDANHGMDITGYNNLTVPASEVADAFEDFTGRDFRPRLGSTFADKRFNERIAAVDPAPETGRVEWVKAEDDPVLDNPYIVLTMRHREQPFFYRERFGQGQLIAGVNEGYNGAAPDSGAYESGAPRWIPGIDGTTGSKWRDWLWESGLDGTTGRMAGPGDDPDGDGLPNLFEWIFGGNPRLAGSAGRESKIVLHEGCPALRFVRTVDSAANVMLTVQWSTNLLEWVDVPVGTGPSGPDDKGIRVVVGSDAMGLEQLYIVFPSEGAPARFARIVAFLVAD